MTDKNEAIKPQPADQRAELSPHVCSLLPCPFCGQEPSRTLADPGAPYPGGYFEIWCDNNDCPVEVSVSEKRRTDISGMTHQEAEQAIWPEMEAKWNTRANNIISGAQNNSEDT